MTNPVIVFDLDGTIVDFILGYTVIANNWFGTPIVKAVEQSDWNLDEALGLTEVQTNLIWNHIQGHDRFWAELPAIGEPKEMQQIAELAEEFDTYFVTMRSGVAVKRQSEEWLVERGIKNPSVIVTRGGRLKGPLALAIGATYLLEDNIGIAEAVAKDSPGTSTFLIERPYNLAGAVGVRHVKTIDEYLTLITQ